MFSQTLSVILAGMARNEGAEIWEGCAADRLVVESGHVSGVATSGHLVMAPRVLVAAGAWSAPLLARSSIFLPTKSFVLSALILVGDHGGLRFMSEFEAGHYLMPRSPATLLLGLPPSDIGVDVDRFPRHPDPAAAAEWLGLLRRRVPALRKAGVAGGWAGVLVATPDAWPLVGRFGPEGCSWRPGSGAAGYSEWLRQRRWPS